MSKAIKVVLTILLFVSFAVSAAASDEVRSDGWKGMVLDVSTPEDAVRLFGNPSKDKDQIILDLPRPLSWHSDKYKQKIFRTLTYKKLKPYKQVSLSFLDGKLVAIALEAPNGEIDDDWIDPDDLEKLFGVVFKPHKRQRNRQLPPPAEFQQSAPAELEKKDDYDYWYDMIAVGEKSFIVAIADATPYQSGVFFDSPDAKRRKKINARGLRYPGFVSDIQITSLSLAR